MLSEKSHIGGLLQLHRVDDDLTRVGVWRQSMAALAAQAVKLGPVPLEGLEPTDLEASIRVAIARGFVDDLGWLSPSNAAAALYELAAALPMGDVRRELGRRVLHHLNEGNAETFSILAAQLAMSSRKVLTGPAIRARVSLAMDLPTLTNGRAAALALALLSHPTLTREWLTLPSTGSLPSRRLAARLLECAAIEVIRRVEKNDDYAVAVFEQPEVMSAWNRLLADREPLVWNHVAVARGMLSKVMPHFAEQIDQELEVASSPTDVRRAATSLAAQVGIDPDHGLALCHVVLRGDIFRRNPGVSSSMVNGLVWAIEAEPDAANGLLCKLLEVGDLQTVEAFEALSRSGVGQLATRTRAAARMRIEHPHFSLSKDDGRIALVRSLRAQFGADPMEHDVSALGGALARARMAYVEGDARQAYALGVEVLCEADATLRALLGACRDEPAGRWESFLCLREFDRWVLQSPTLVNLLWLGAGSAEALALKRLQAQHQSLGNWLVEQEGATVVGDRFEHFMVRERQLHALLHLVDGNLSVGEEKPANHRETLLRTTRVLLERAQDDVPAAYRPVVCTAAARACDALLREEIAELSDVLIAVALHVRQAGDLETLADASMDSVAAELFHAHASFVERTSKAQQRGKQQTEVALDSLGTLIRAFPSLTTPRVEALRRALVALADAVQAVQSAPSLEAVSFEGGQAPSPMSQFADAASLLVRLTIGARRRFGQPCPEAFAEKDATLRAIDINVAWALREGADVIGPAVEAASAALRRVLPAGWADIAARALEYVAQLPISKPDATGVPSAPLRLHRGVPLPQWLPPNRVVGGFYVIRPFGSGAVGSVFAACRAEDKDVRDAPRFALKVPEYGGDVARTLSQKEFLDLFREEAGALLTIPVHPNLARFVTFDAGARPKPILVMELVEGPTLQRLIDTATLSVDEVFNVLDGVAAGLEAMHRDGLGHLDVKPSNVILRDPEPPSSESEASQDDDRIPVLVDFGLAGRKVRPGCATVSYGAPEVWGHVPEGAQSTPAAVDTYAFGCLIYESLTGRELFDAVTQRAVLSMHIQHDADMPALQKMTEDADLVPLAAIIRSAVRRDPRDRALLHEIREALRDAAGELSELPWPLTGDADEDLSTTMKTSVARTMLFARRRGARRDSFAV